MNWTNQYLQTKYLNLISHIISSRMQRYDFFSTFVYIKMI